MPTPKPFNILAKVMEKEPHLAVLLRRHQLEASLTRVVRTCLPPLLASQVRVTDLRDGQLELTVPSGTLATAVRQRSPELLIALASQFHEFNRIRVRVQPLASSMSPQAPHSRRPPPVVAPLQSLARNLPDGPLRNAILRLIKAK